MRNLKREQTKPKHYFCETFQRRDFNLPRLPRWFPLCSVPYLTFIITPVFFPNGTFSGNRAAYFFNFVVQSVPTFYLFCSVFSQKDAIFTSAGIFERSNLAAPDSASLGIDSTKHLWTCKILINTMPCASNGRPRIRPQMSILHALSLPCHL